MKIRFELKNEMLRKGEREGEWGGIKMMREGREGKIREEGEGRKPQM